jgi:hypothetical protein
MPDGVFALQHGRFGAQGHELVFAGGNCSIIGLDITGKDEFWTVREARTQASKHATHVAFPALVSECYRAAAMR